MPENPKAGGASKNTDKQKVAELLLAEKVKRISTGALRARYNMASPPRCLDSDWHQMLRNLGLGYTDLEALKAKVRQLGLPEPKRIAKS